MSLVAIGFGIAVIATLWPLTRDATPSLEDRCALVARGDTIEEAYRYLGRAGYRKGCGSVTPCETLDLGPELGTWPWLCDPDDCSQLWRDGDDACLVELDPGTRVVTEVTFTRYGP